MVVPPQLFLIPFVLVESGARSLYFFVNLAQADNLFQFFPYSSILAVLHPTLFPPNFYLLAYQFYFSDRNLLLQEGSMQVLC